MLKYLYSVETNYELSFGVDLVIIAILALVAIFTTATFLPMFAVYVIGSLVVEKIVNRVIQLVKVVKD